MSYRIEIEAGALKTLSKLDKPVRRRLEAAIDRLADDPRPAGVVAMKSMPDHLRLRVGDYRIVYAVQDHILVVLVVGWATAARFTADARRGVGLPTSGRTR